MSFKRPFRELSSQELQQKLRRLIHYFERGESLTDDKLDTYLLLKKRIEELDVQQEPEFFRIVELEIDGTMVLGEIIALEKFYIEVEIIYPYVNWKNYSCITGPGRATPYHFLRTYKKVSERLLLESYKKIKMIDERIDRIINVHDDLLAEINEISIMDNEKVKSRITDKLDDWFYKDFLFVSSVTGMIASISDRPQIENIITEYKSTQRKIYMI